MKIIIFCIWIIVILVLWLPTTSLKIDEPFKRFEFKGKSISYLVAVIVSLLIGIFLGNHV
jgi:hypothetical protein